MLFRSEPIFYKDPEQGIEVYHCAVCAREYPQIEKAKECHCKELQNLLVENVE